jgi:hypothetical protein
MCVILLLALLMRRDRLAAFYLIQALAIFGLSLLALFGERPVLVCGFHLLSASMYAAFAIAHVGHLSGRPRVGLAKKDIDAGSGP